MLAVVLAKQVAIYKIDFQASKLELLQKITTDISASVDSSSTCLRWSSDNLGLAVGGDDRIIKLYKVKAPNDFKSEMQMTCELKTEHFDSINCIDISPSKTLLVSSGNDSQA